MWQELKRWSSSGWSNCLLRVSRSGSPQPRLCYHTPRLRMTACTTPAGACGSSFAAADANSDTATPQSFRVPQAVPRNLGVAYSAAAYVPHVGTDLGQTCVGAATRRFGLVDLWSSSRGVQPMLQLGLVGESRRERARARERAHDRDTCSICAPALPPVYRLTSSSLEKKRGVVLVRLICDTRQQTQSHGLLHMCDT